MKRRGLERRLAVLVLLATACNADFRFDRGPAAGASAMGDGARSATGGTDGGTPDGGTPDGGTPTTDGGTPNPAYGGSSGADGGSSNGGASYGGSSNAGSSNGGGSYGGSSNGGSGGMSGRGAVTGCADCTEYGLVCAPDWHACVECVADADCPVEKGYCDAASHRCTLCRYEDGCDSGYICDSWSHSCLRSCATEVDPDHDCGHSTRMCDRDQNRNVCVECHDDDGCRGNPNGEHCAAQARCAECTGDADCTGGRYCDLLTFACVTCRDYRDCSASSVCDPKTHTCVPGDE